MTAPTIDELTIAGAPPPWEEAGFEVSDGELLVGTVRLCFDAAASRRGIAACTVRSLQEESPDGLPMSVSSAPVRARREQPHPNGVVSLDHLVAFTPALERTIPALERAGLELRRLREEPTPGGAPRQAFFRLGEVILELVEQPPGSREERDASSAARFWGLAFSVRDLEATANVLGERLGAPRDAVQPGRRIATVRREAGLGVAVALMTPGPGAA
jgi:Glyoxalase-like domain